MDKGIEIYPNSNFCHGSLQMNRFLILKFRCKFKKQFLCQTNFERSKIFQMLILLNCNILKTSELYK